MAGQSEQLCAVSGAEVGAAQQFAQCVELSGAEYGSIGVVHVV